MRMVVKIRNSVGRREEDRINHMTFADNCYLFVESKEQIVQMIEDATEELKKKGFDWKDEEMELISWGFYEGVGDIYPEIRDKKYVIREVTSLQAMGALISKEADSVSALKFRMNKVDKALWMDMKFYKKMQKARNTKVTERWCSRAFFTHVKGGFGTRKWWTLCTGGSAGTWTS